VVDWFHCNLRRSDVATALSLSEEEMSLTGFHTIPPALLQDGKRHLVEVVEGRTGKLLTQGQRYIQWSQNGVAFPQSNAKPPTTVAKIKFPPPLVSVVILNRNGAGLLETLFASWQTHNCRVPAEIIVIDHDSSDNSLAVLRHWQRKLDLRVIALPRNDSFSASCNLGASYANAPNLLFMNNDIELVQDVLSPMLESLQDPSVGIVGLKLVKEFANPLNNRIKTQVVQHLGVRFILPGGVTSSYWPYEAMPATTGIEAENTPVAVPAVTGAALLCRKQDFDAVSGFDLEYFYGFEDVEFCLRLSQRLQKKVICRNDCTALHHHGFTRLSGRERKVLDRVSHNSNVLERHVGFWLKQRWWSSLLSNDGYYTRETLCIGLVGGAIKLAASIARSFAAAKIRLLVSDQQWKQVHQCHVLVVGDARYDIHMLEHPRCDLLTIAYVEADPELWTEQSWWHQFEAVLVPSSKARTLIPRLHTPAQVSTAAMPLGHLLDVGRRRMRVLIAVDMPEANSCKKAALLQRQLQKNKFACWIVDAASSPTRMFDVCVRLDHPTATIMTSRIDAGVMYVDWPRSLPAPSAKWLTAELETHLGSTFRSS
jgi:GT2 family glycosyltransferase